MLEGPPRLADLAATAPERDASWTEYDVPGLIDHVVSTHHAYLVREVPRLRALGAKLGPSSEGARAIPELEELLGVLDKLDEELGPHLATEEEVLFPWCRRLHAGEPLGEWIAARLRCMHRDHRSTGALLDELRRLATDFEIPAGATADERAFLIGLAGLDADTRLHLHKEEDVLFPAVLAAAAG